MINQFNHDIPGDDVIEQSSDVALSPTVRIQASDRSPDVAVLDSGIETPALFAQIANGVGLSPNSASHGAKVARVLKMTCDEACPNDITPHGIEISYSAASLVPSVVNAITRNPGIEVFTSSWGLKSDFEDDFQDDAYAPARQAIETAIIDGRDGLGTVFVFAAGNSYQQGDNVNHHNFQNAPETIAVGALDADGDPASFSTPGAAVLISALGVDVPLTSADVYSGTGVDGTSYAAPQVSAIATLMLTANPDLGYRDVQEILALTAAPTATDDPDWTRNGAETWNGGGLTFNNRVGFGALDGEAALRLATVWQDQNTAETLATASAGASPNAPIPGGSRYSLERSVLIEDAIAVEHVTVALEIDHGWIGDLTVTLISPEGTRSVLLDRPGKTPGDFYSYGLSSDDIDFTLTSLAFRGEDGAGSWTLEVVDHTSWFSGRLEAFTVTVAGKSMEGEDGDDDRYVFTDAFADLADPETPLVLTDQGGHDLLEAAALSDDAVIDLRPYATSTLAGETVTMGAHTLLEDAHAGAGDDRLFGNVLGNRLSGGPGNDVLTGGAGADVFVFGADFGHDRVTDFQPGVDRVTLVGETAAADIDWTSTGGDLVGRIGSDASLTLTGAAHTDFDLLFA